MITRLLSGLTCLLSVIAIPFSEASAEGASPAKWRAIGTTQDKLGDGTSLTSTLYVEAPVMRSDDKGLSVVHYRIEFAPAVKGLRPGEETRTIESIGVFDCQKHEYWTVYGMGLPFPALRNTVNGSGERRQIRVNNFDSDAVRETDWPGVTVAAFVCTPRPRT